MITALNVFIEEYGYPRRFFVERIAEKHPSIDALKDLASQYNNVVAECTYMLIDNETSIVDNNTRTIYGITKFKEHGEHQLIDTYVLTYFINSVIKNAVLSSSSTEIAKNVTAFVCYYYAISQMRQTKYNKDISPTMQDITEQVISYIGSIISIIIDKEDTTYSKYGTELIQDRIRMLRRMIVQERVNLVGRNFNLRR